MAGKRGAECVLEFLYGTQWQDLSLQVRNMAVTCLRDLLGVAAGALRTDATRIICDHAVSHYGAGATGPVSRLIFDGRQSSPSGAALAAAMSIDSLDGHDGYRPTKGHIGAWALPAILAITDANAAQGKPISGQEFLTMLTIGYELGSRLGVAQHASVPDYHASGSWGAVGSAALASRLLGLDSIKAREAMGIAEYHSPRSQMMRCIDHPTMVKDSSGWGAMTGISSTYMAADGFTGAPSLIIDSQECDDYWQDLGEQWLILEQYFKPYPVCRWAQAAIAATQDLQLTHQFTPDMIEKVEIITFHEGCRLDHPRPSTTEQAQYSLPFPVAAILAKGQCGAEEVTTGLNDPDILAIADRVIVTEDDEYNRRFPAERLARAVIELKNGQRLASSTVQAEGDPETPLTPGALKSKYQGLAYPTLGENMADEVWALAGDLMDAESVSPFLGKVLSRPDRALESVKTTNSAA